MSLSKQIRKYENSCERLLDSFIKIYFPRTDVSESDVYWIGDEVGGVCDINSFAVPFNTILQCLKNNIPPKTFFDWYDNVFSNPGAEIKYNIQSYSKITWKPQ